MTTSSTPHTTTTQPASKAKPTVLRAVIYCRVSGTSQEENGSLRDQERRCRARCTEEGATVLAVYHEVWSGKDIYRPKLAAVRERARAGEFNLLVVDKTDRLSRGGPYDTAFLRRELDENGVRVVILNAPEDSPTQELVNSVMEWSDRYERERIIERTYGGRVRRVKKGEGRQYGILGVKTPRFGYRFSDDRTHYELDDNPGPKQVLTFAVRELAEAVPPRSLSSIVNEMNDLHPPPYAYYQQRGWLPPTATVGQHWSAEIVRRIIRDDAYLAGSDGRSGFKAFRTEQVPVAKPRPRADGFVPKGRTRAAPRAPDDPLLADQSDLCPPLWTTPEEIGWVRKARERLSKNRYEKLHQPQHIDARLLRGMVYCGYCGTRMTGGNTGNVKQGGRRTPTYICYRHGRFRKRELDRDCPGGYVSLASRPLDEAAWRQVVELLSSQDKLLEAYSRAEQDADREVKTKELRLAALDDQIAAAEAEVRKLDLLVREDAEQRAQGTGGMNPLIVKRWEADLNAAANRLTAAVAAREAALSEVDHTVARAQAFQGLLTLAEEMAWWDANPDIERAVDEGGEEADLTDEQQARFNAYFDRHMASFWSRRAQLHFKALIDVDDHQRRDLLEKLGVRVTVRNPGDGERATLHVDIWDEDVPLDVRQSYTAAQVARTIPQAAGGTSSTTHDQ